MGIGMLSSADLKTWQREKPVLNPTPEWAKDPVPAYRGHTWAPDIIRAGDKWYIYYSCSTFGKNISAIGVATNKTLNPESPDYKWEDLGMVIKSEPGVDDWNAIDPNVVYDENGKPWLTYGSFWDGIQIVGLKKDMKTPVGKSKTIARRRKPCDFGHNGENAGANAIEAPFIVNKDGWYYLFVSHDYCCKGLKSDYKTVVGRSRNIEGPYLDRDGWDMSKGGGTLLIGPSDRYSGVGHCSVYKFGDQWLFAAHGYDKAQNGASKLVLRDIKWDADGWPSLE
ncbi:MAG: family 43 glycosylhydrolase [Muribaculum sp.]|nr:family 43 glycosylhydrolase [Muribaculum sp.]